MKCSAFSTSRLSSCTLLLVLSAPAAMLRVQDGFHADAGGAFLYGPIYGRVQTPRGGEPGTTSSGRPSLGELGIDNAGEGDFWANVGPLGLLGLEVKF
jgi:hypothetical protein